MVGGGGDFWTYAVISQLSLYQGMQFSGVVRGLDISKKCCPQIKKISARLPIR